MKYIFLTIGVVLVAMLVIVFPTPRSFGAVEIRSPLIAKETKVLFVGDIFFDRTIRQYQEQYGEDYPFSCIDDLFKQANFVVGNLEGPITAHPSVSLGSAVGSPENFTFTFATTTAELLYRHNVRLVDLGNNHIENFGLEGIVSTHEYLSAAKVEYFGGVGGDEPIARIDQDGIPLSFVSYNQFGGVSSANVAEKIASERAAGRIVVVFAHWGEEYSTTTTELQRTTARVFVENGASLIVGAHPHVIIPSEVVGAVPVYYSLGNFIFDQYFSADVIHGLALLVTFSPDGSMSTQEFPVTMAPDRRTCPVL